MRSIRILTGLLLLADVALAQAPAPLPSAQPDWPCKGVRVAEMTLGGLWNDPAALDAARKNWRDDAAIADLVARVAPRRTPIDEAQKLIAEFAKAAGDKRKQRVTTLFAGLAEKLSDERRDVVNGLDRFGRRLKEMAEKTREETQTLRDLQNQKPQDPEAIRKASEALQWRLRLFDEQRKMIAFVCESPALIEQRLGALARAAQSAME